MKPLFQLRPDATIEEVTQHLALMCYQISAVQGQLFELTHVRNEILGNFEQIGALISQNENNAEQMQQLAAFLNERQIAEVKS